MPFNKYNHSEDKFIPTQFNKTLNRLDPGVYSFTYDYDHELGWFEKRTFQCDEIIDLPSVEFKQLISEMDTFLKVETKEKFQKFGFLYKRSTLLYGSAGVGKTVLVNRMTRQVIEKGGIVIFNPDPQHLEYMFKYLVDIEPETLTLVIFEELDSLIEHGEKDLLHLLDGEIQKPNTMYLATTNFVGRIPKRLCRPGRFSSIIEVRYPTYEARVEFLKHKKVPKGDLVAIAKATDGFSIDEVKEVVLSTQCLGIGLEKIINRVRSTKKMTEDLPEDSIESSASKYSVANASANRRLRGSSRSTSGRF